MRDPSNIAGLVRLNPDFIGFIFYPKSKRFIGEKLPDEIQGLIPASIQKVGVFVDEPFNGLIGKYNRSNLDIVQLHGGELPDYCKGLKEQNIPVIKVFSITPDFDFRTINPYEPVCDYYLFDTASESPGGSGIKFNWTKLDQYQGNKPFFLSGGIQPGDIGQINPIQHQHLYGVDVNSGFEVEPGIKDISKLGSFIDRLRNIDN